MTQPTQTQMFYMVQRKISDGNQIMCELLANGEISQKDLARLIERRPSIYARFAGFLTESEGRANSLTHHL